jgi:Na+-driven multidrug efflux pump
MNLDTVKAALNIVLVLYLVGFPIWTLLAYAQGRNHPDSSLIVTMILFIIAITLYVFAITFELPRPDKHGKAWAALFLVAFETITIAIAMLIGAIRTFTKRVEDIDA